MKNQKSKIEGMIEEIGKLTVLELADLVKALEERFGVSGQTMMAPIAAEKTQANENDKEKTAGEQTTFNVVLSEIGANKIQVIKAVREVKPDLGLKDAKDLVEAAPKEILTGVNKSQAEEAKKKLEAMGAKVELK